MQVELDSYTSMNHTTFSNMSVSMVNCFSSEIIIENVYGSNIVSDEFIIDFYFCPKVTIKNLHMTDCTTLGQISMIHMRETVVESIQNSDFINSQLAVMHFENSQLKSSFGNSFDAMNKALKFTGGSTGVVTNSTFKNMVQKIKEGSIYQSRVNSDGSAIGKDH
jgi:hypothetical protein